MSLPNSLSSEHIKTIAKLANLVINDMEVGKLAKELSDTLEFIEKIKLIDTKKLKITSNVTGLSNVFREDEIVPSLTQKQALSGTKSTHNGYFKVRAVLEE